MRGVVLRATLFREVTLLKRDVLGATGANAAESLGIRNAEFCDAGNLVAADPKHLIA